MSEAIPLRKQIAMGKGPKVSTGGPSPGMKKGGAVKKGGGKPPKNC